ncbi:glutamate ligase [Bifidobacterium dolichotidis]|uniref:Lipid II isoglutaminyl synthase (glutamine-hydrolyzing) subunit MurT n=1 Tax=Bifidobacterium dolichotidis TaxID=2306976 RepID=A0A430FQU6_9BIFI|nr:Mur ligase family protein [Bifidobacterium dolichotidis]RSX55174.1 glutamate ligase [Bifidobacterium dolichotidis]
MQDSTPESATTQASTPAATEQPVPTRNWHSFATPAIGKAVRWAARVTRHGGSAFPGKVIERLDPGFLRRTLGRLPLGVVLVSGTNGKTTTTRMVASMLSDLGLKVFTNPTGSNFTRGVVSALLNEVTLNGHLDADIAVLELDEAYAVHFVHQVKPRYALLLNVMRDQLDRFGEIDNTARLLGHVASATTREVVLNREDPRISALAELVPDGTKTSFFGLSQDLRKFFPTDDDMATTLDVQLASEVLADTEADADSTAEPLPANAHADCLAADVTLTAVGDHEAQFCVANNDYSTQVQLEGVYNLYNSAAALGVVRAVQRDAKAALADAPTFRRMQRFGSAGLPERLAHFANASIDDQLSALAQVTPAFGRGERITVGNSVVELLLVKNPMGFRLSLASFPPENADTMIVINDQYADGRDMSWLWDVDFTSLKETGVAMVSGVRAWDMALRLDYDDVPHAAVEPDIETALEQFLRNPAPVKHIYCTYTSMLAVRAALARVTEVSDAGVGR